MIIFIKTIHAKLSLDIDSSATLFELYKIAKERVGQRGNLILNGKILKETKEITLEEIGIKVESKIEFQEPNNLQITVIFEGTEETVIVPARADVTIHHVRQEIRNKWPNEESFFKELPRVFYDDQELYDNDIAADVFPYGRAKIRVERPKCKSKNNNNNNNNNNNADENTTIKDNPTFYSAPKMSLKGITFKSKVLSPTSAVKLVAIGDGAVGKTSMLITYTSNAIPTGHIPKIIDNCEVDVIYKDTRVALGLWDTPCHGDHDRLRVLFYPGADVFLICFSVVSPASFYNRYRWMQEMNYYAPGVPFIYVATKSDLFGDKDISERLASRELKILEEDEIRNAAEEDGAAAYVICSSLTQKNLKDVFDIALKTVFDPTSKKKKKSTKILSSFRNIFASKV